MLYSLLKNESFAARFKYAALFDREISPFSDRNKEQISKLIPSVEFFEINNNLYRQFPAKEKGANISLLKFEVLQPQPYEYSIYVDTDILFLLPITKLIEELENAEHFILGVENTSRANVFREYAFETFSMNAGFFIVKNGNLDLRVYEQLQDEISEINKMGEVKQMICQPILNKTCAELGLKYLSAPFFYNFRYLNQFENYRDNVSVLHFVSRTLGTDKPWEQLNSAETSSAQQTWSFYFQELQNHFELNNDRKLKK